MIKISDGINTMIVTNGAYNSMYKNMGFAPYAEIEIKEEKDIETPDKSDEEIFLEKILEKPISEWSKNEVKKFADIKEIDLVGTKNATEAKDVISKWLEENE